MSFKMPSVQFFGIAVAAAVVAGVLGYLVYPVFATVDPRGLFGVALVVGIVIGAFLSGFQRGARPARTPAATGETKTLFVGNLAFKASRANVQSLFGQYGRVHSVKIMTERGTRRPRGFGFVEMDARDANAAIGALDGAEFFGRNLKVSEANERRPRPSPSE